MSVIARGRRFHRRCMMHDIRRAARAARAVGRFGASHSLSSQCGENFWRVNADRGNDGRRPRQPLAQLLIVRRERSGERFDHLRLLALFHSELLTGEKYNRLVGRRHGEHEHLLCLLEKHGRINGRRTVGRHRLRYFSLELLHASDQLRPSHLPELCAADFVAPLHRWRRGWLVPA